MTISEILKAQGLGEDAVQAVLDAMKTNRLFISGEENIDARYGKLKEQHGTAMNDLAAANKRIKELEGGHAEVTGLQQQLADAQQQLAQAQAQMTDYKLRAAIKVGLMAAKAKDVDYLTYQLYQRDEKPQLDDHDQVKNWDDLLSGLKTSNPAFFEDGSKGTYVEHRLPDNKETGGTLTREEILKKPYSERAKLYEQNPEGFAKAMEAK